MTILNAQRKLVDTCNRLCEISGCHEFTVKISLQTLSAPLGDSSSIVTSSTTTISPKPQVKRIEGGAATWHGVNETYAASHDPRTMAAYQINLLPRTYTDSSGSHGYELSSFCLTPSGPTQRCVILLSGGDLPSETAFTITGYTITPTTLSLTVQGAVDYG